MIDIQKGSYTDIQYMNVVPVFELFIIEMQ